MHESKWGMLSSAAIIYTLKCMPQPFLKLQKAGHWNYNLEQHEPKNPWCQRAPKPRTPIWKISTEARHGAQIEQERQGNPQTWQTHYSQMWPPSENMGRQRRRLWLTGRAWAPCCPWRGVWLASPKPAGWLRARCHPRRAQPQGKQGKYFNFFLYITSLQNSKFFAKKFWDNVVDLSTFI
jgi:hypothetical protein